MHLVVIVDVVVRMDHGTLTSQVAGEFGSIKERLTQRQGAPEVLASDRSRQKKLRGILESNNKKLGQLRLGQDDLQAVERETH